MITILQMKKKRCKMVQELADVHKVSGSIKLWTQVQTPDFSSLSYFTILPLKVHPIIKIA